MQFFQSKNTGQSIDVSYTRCVCEKIIRILLLGNTIATAVYLVCGIYAMLQSKQWIKNLKDLLASVDRDSGQVETLPCSKFYSNVLIRDLCETICQNCKPTTFDFFIEIIMDS
uniref:Uncharacterized protein n=1 Tax=Glossina austeni TaxID=7395 RepID=A0A1A9UEK3_GLOAU